MLLYICSVEIKEKGAVKIDLEPPFSNDYIADYLNTNKEPRRVVLLVRENKTKTSVSYARYLMTCHLGRYLRKDEHVDHIDNDKMNDVIENFQILTPKENTIKSKHCPMTEMNCPICGKAFSVMTSILKFKKNYNKSKTITCSRGCGGKMSHITKNKKDT